MDDKKKLMTYQEAIKLKGGKGCLCFYQVSKKAPKLPVRNKDGEIINWKKQSVICELHGTIIDVEKINLLFRCNHNHDFIVALKDIRSFNEIHR